MRTNFTFTNMTLFVCFLGAGFMCSKLLQKVDEQKVKIQSYERNDTAVVKTKNRIDSIEAQNRKLKNANFGYTRFFEQIKEDSSRDTSGPPCCRVCARLRFLETKEIEK